MIPAAALRALWQPLMPDRVTVGYQVRTAVGTYATSANVADCWWRPGQTADYGPSDGVAVKALRTWMVPKTATTITPALGDILTNPVTTIDPVAASWTVIGLQDVGGLGAWQLDAISLQLSAGLRGTLTFSRPDTSQDSSYRPAPTYSAFAANVPARVQPEGGEAGEVFDRITLPRRFTAFIDRTLVLRAHDKATDDAGAVYTVLGWSQPERLDELQRVDLELIG